MNSGGGVFGALIFVIGVLAAFAVMFGLFLIVPFFIFLAGIVVMLVSDRKRSSEDNGGGDDPPAETGKANVKIVETTTEVRETRH